MSVLFCTKLVKCFKDGTQSHEILKGIDWSLTQGESAVIFGRSGSGKSTFLHCLSGLEPVTKGQVVWRDKPLKDYHLSDLYRQDFGFVFQSHYLLADFNVLENVALSGRLAGWSWSKAMAEATALLTHLGLQKRIDFKVQSLSGGERQRVSIARALLTKPACVFADEPTAHLDRETAHQLINWIQTLKNNGDVSFVITSHDPFFLDVFPNHYTLSDGHLNKES